MNTLTLLKYVEKYPLFTFNEFVRITNKPSPYCRTAIYRLKKKKLVFEIEKGKYTIHEDPLIFSSYILQPSYISFWTALRFYNLTTQLPHTIMLAAFRSKKKLSFLATPIHFYKLKHLWGYKKVRYGLFDIFLADAEKTIVDCLLLPVVPFAEVLEALSSPDIDKQKLISYALKTKNSSLIKRTGYLLEKQGFLAEALQPFIDYNYILLDLSRNKQGQKNKKWRIIDNASRDNPLSLSENTMIECETIIEKWRNSLGIKLPKMIVQSQHLKENETVKIIISKKENSGKISTSQEK